MTVISDTQIVPPALRCAGPARRRPGRGRRPGVRPLRPHQARLRRPVAHLHRLMRRGGVAVDAGGPPHRGPLPVSARWLRRQHRHPAPRRHRQGPRAPLPGPGRQRSAEGLVSPVGQAPASGPGALTADVLAVIRLTAAQPRRRGRGIETSQRPLSGASSTWPWRLSSLTGGCVAASGVDLGRRPALGRRQRPHHRHPLQDRRGGAGRGGGHHPHRHACPGRRPAGGLVVR